MFIVAGLLMANGAWADTKTGETVQLSNSAGTFVSPADLDFSTSTVKAYRITGVGKRTTPNSSPYEHYKLNFVKTNTVAKGEPVILMRDGVEDFEEVIPYASEAVTAGENLLVAANEAIASLASEETDGRKNFILSSGSWGLGFYRANNCPVPAGKAYLQLPAAAPANAFLSFEDVITAINGIAAEQAKQEIYNLAGQRVEKAVKGIYVINGKKVIVK